MFGVAIEEARAQTNFFWTNSVDGSWSVNGNWTNDVPAGSVAPVAGGNVNYGIFVQTNNYPRLYITVDNALLSNNKFWLNQFVSSSTMTGTNHITNTTAGAYLVFSTNTSGGLPQLLQNGTAVARFGIGVMLTNDLNVGGSGTATMFFDKDLAGTNTLFKSGNFNLRLTVSNSFSGGLVITDGSVVADNNKAVVNVPVINVSNLGQFAITANGVYTNAFNLGGLGADGVGANRGALYFNVGGGGYRMSGPITISTDTRIGSYASGTSYITNAGSISGTGNLSFWGGGSAIGHAHNFILVATNSYTGTTTFNNSNGKITVQLAGTNVLPTGTVLVLAGTSTNMARLNMAGYDQTIAGLATTGTGASNVVASTVTGLSRLTINNAVNYVYGGQMASNIMVIKSGTGVQTLSGTNTYSGGTLISNGVLRLENTFSLPSSGTITLASNTAAVAYNIAGGLAGTLFPKIANITTTPGIIALTTNTATAADTINFSTYANLYLGAAETLTNATTYTPYQTGGVNYFNLGGGAVGAVMTFPTAIADTANGGSLSVVRIGGSQTARTVVELAGANTYTGGTFLNGGILSVSSDANLGGASSAMTFGGGVLRVTGATLTNIDSRTVNWSTFNGGFDIRDAGTVFTITNVVGGSSGFLKLGAGVLDLRGADNFTGDVVVQGGALRAEWGTGIPLTANLVLTGGVWETASGLANQSLGSGAGQLRLAGSTGGFSAVTTPLTVNLGGAGDTIQWGSAFFNPGVLMLNETSADQSLSFVNPLDFNGAVRTVAVNGVSATLAGGVLNSSGTAGLVKAGSGTLLLTNTTPMVFQRSIGISGGTLTLATGTTTITSGGPILLTGTSTFNVNGTLVASNVMQVGTSAFSRAIVTVGPGASLLFTNTAACIIIGTVGGTGAVYQTGGTIINSPTATTGEGVFAPGFGGYGYYRMTDGLLVNNGRFSIGGALTTSIGVFEQFGGVVTNREWVIWRKGPAAQINLFGGEFNANNSGGFTLNYDGVNYNVLNVAGATVNLAMGNTLPLNLGRQVGGTGIVNLLSGTLTVNQVMATAAGQTYLNFDGGTLRANPVTTLAGVFMPTTLAGVVIYDGGATFLVESNIVTILQPLLGPTLKGISSIVTNGLTAAEISGYIGTPAVKIEGGSGAGASAVAQIDFATGVLTNILVTSAGSGYQAGDTLTITLMGGGNTNVILGNYTLADNANTGSLTKSGDGAIFLLGANTYGGPTVINGGGLLLSNTSTSISAAALSMVGASAAIGPTNVLDQAFVDWLAGRMPGVVATGAVLLAVNSANDLNFSGTMTNVFLGGLSNAVYTGGATWADTTVRLGNGPGVFTYGHAIGDGTNLVIGPVGGNPLSVVMLTNVNTHASTLINAGMLMVSNDFSLGAASAPIIFNGGNLNAFGTTNLVVTGRAVTFSADAGIGGSNVTFTGTVDLGGVARTLSVSNLITSMEGTVSNGGLIKEGRGTLMLSAANSYIGGTWLNGGILSVSNANALGGGHITFSNGVIGGFGQPLVTITQFVDFAGNGFIGAGSNLLFNKTVNLGGEMRTINVSNSWTRITSVVQNGGVTKSGPGVLALDGANTYTGGTYIAGGTLNVDGDASFGAVPGSPTTNIFFTANSVLLLTNSFTINTNRIITVQAGVTQADIDVTNGIFTLGNALTGEGTLRIHSSGAGGGTLVLTGVDDVALTVLRNNSNTTLVLSNLTGAAMLGNLQVGNNSGGADAYLYTAAPNQFGPNSVLSFSIGSGKNGRFQLLGNDQVVAGLSDTSTRGIIGNTHDETGYGDSTLTVSNSAFYSYNGYMRDTLSGSGILGFIKDGPATQVLAGANITYTGPTTIRGGALYLSNVTAFASPVITNGSQLVFDFTAANALSYAGVITGAGTLTKQGAGALQLAGNNDFAGDTFVSGGILQAAFGAGFSPNSRVVLNGGTISTLSGTVTNSIGAAAGQIQFTPGAAGGFSAYNGPLTVNMDNDGHTLVFGSANFNPSALTLNDTVANNNLTFVNGLDLSGAARVIAANATNIYITATVTGIITNSGANADLRKLGPGVLALTGNNKFTGGLLVEGGVLRAEWGAGIPTTANLVLTGGVWETASGATPVLGAGAGAMRLPGSTGGFSAITAPLTVNLDGFGGTIQWGGALFNPSVFLLNAATASATLDVVNILDLYGADRVFAVNSGFDYPATISGVINNSLGTAGLIKAGPGLLILPDTTANTFNGNVTVREGVLRASWTAGLPATANLMLTGGVWETTGGSITASLGTGAGQVQLPGSTGGFSAVTLPMTINLGGANATVVWGSSTFNPTQLVLNASTANQPINFDNPIDFGNAAVRSIAVNASTVTLAQIVVSGTNTAGLTKTGNGMLILTNTTPVTLSRGVNVNGGTLWLTPGTTNNFGAASMSGNSRLIIEGPVEMSANNLNVGNVGAGDRNMLFIGTNLNASRLLIGAAADTVAAVYQTGGVVNLSVIEGNNEGFSLGQGGLNAYGYYLLTNGSLNVTAGRMAIGGAYNSSAAKYGVFDMLGGTVNVKTYVFIVRSPGGAGVLNVFGGQFNAGDGNDSSMDRGGVGYAVMNIGGLGQAALANFAVASNRAFQVVNDAGGTGTVNFLTGGTGIFNRIYSSVAGVGIVNFNGGTLVAREGSSQIYNGTNFMSGVTGYIYSGGATINTDTNNVIIGAPLLAPTAKGIANITTNGIPVSELDNYLGAPVVKITGGSGVGATAVAMIDPMTGVLTNIMVTSAGSGYLAGDTLTITLIGGGNTNVVLTTGNYSLTDNTSGGLTKTGAGMLVLAGTNTYTGPTVVGAGTLQVGNGGITGTLDNGFIFGSYTFTNNGTLIYNRTDTNTAVNNITGSGGLVVLGSGSGQLNLAGTNDFTGGMAVTNGLLMFTHFGALPAVGSIALDSGVVGLNTNDVATWLLPRLTGSSTGYLALGLTNANDTINFSTYNGLGLASAEDVTYTGVFTPYSADGTNNWWLAAAGGSTFTFTNLITDGPNASLLRIGSNALPGLVGVVALRPQQANTYSGGTFLHGGVLNITNDNALGALPGSPVTNITFQTNATLQFGANMSLDVNRAISLVAGTGTFDTLGNTVVIPGTIGGDGSMGKIGSGTLVLNNNTDSVQFLSVNGGALVLSNMLFTVTGVFANGSVMVGNTALDNNAALVVGGGSVLTRQGASPLTVGNLGSGNSLIVDAGSVFNNSNGSFRIGFGASALSVSSNNQMVINGSLWTATNMAADSFVGYYGVGNSLLITNGGSMDITSSGGLDILLGNYGVSSNNSLVVSGSGSAFRFNQIVYVGNLGSSNSVIVSNGATVTNDNGRFLIGYGSSTGPAIGTNNQLVIDNATWLNTNASGDTIIGNYGVNNSLVVSNGGVLDMAATAGNDFFLGYQGVGSNNSMIVTGAGSRFNYNRLIVVGNLGSSNRITVASGGVINNSTNVFIIGNGSSTGPAISSNNQLVVDGGTWIATNMGTDAVVGNYGIGNALIITNGGKMEINAKSGSDFYLGNAAVSVSNSVVVTGSGSTLNYNRIIQVGNSGSYNTFVVSDGGFVNNSNSSFNVGNGSSTGPVISSNNQLVIDGGVWANTNMSADSSVGNYGVGNSLIITNGGVMNLASATAGNDFLVGFQVMASNNTMRVSGVGSLFQFNQKIFVGNDGSSNALIVAAGGVVTNNNGQLVVGDGGSASLFSSNNMLVIDGGTWINTNLTADLQIGNYGVGNSLSILNGGVMRLGTATVGSVDFLVGNQVGASNNSVLVSGAGSVFVFTNTIYVGYSGNSNAMIVDGGAVTNGGTFSVGSAGSGNLLYISNSGRVNSVTFNIGESAGSVNNTVIVTGNGSVLTNRGTASNQDFRVGNSGGSSSLQVLDGGQVNAARYILIGYNSTSSNNTVLVSGSNSLLTAGGAFDIRVGSSGSSNTMIVADNGRVHSRQDFFVGYFTGSRSNLLVVTDPGSVLTNTRNLFVGYYTGTFANAMVVTNGGQVFVGGYSTIGHGIGAGGVSSNNSALVSGTGSIWRTAGALTVGAFGEGNSLTVNNTGAVFAAGMTLGQSGSFNTLSLFSGAGFTNAGLLQIGGGGGASNNTMTLSGADTRFFNSGETYLGATDTHHNVLQILDGAMMTNSSFFLVGRRFGADNNTLIVDNASLLNGNSVLAIGGGAGIGNIGIFTNGAQVLAQEFNVGRGGVGTNNAAYITGVGTLMQVTGASGIQVGRGDAFNSLFIGGGATVTNAGLLTVGVSAATSNNWLQVTGAGTRLWVGGNATLGESASSLVEGNQMVLDSGATVVLGGNLTISTNSILRNLGTAVLQLAGDFDNLATNFAQSDFSGSFVFNGGTARTQLVEIASAYAADMAANNFMYGTFQVGDPVTVSNAYVRLVDERGNTAGAGSEILAASNLIVATSGSVLELTNRTVFAFNLANAGTIQQGVLGGVARLDIVNTFTNQGNLYASGGGILQFSNAFINAGNGIVGLVGGTFNDFLTGGVLTNLGTIGGGGTVSALIANGATGRIAATNSGAGAVLTLGAGFASSGGGPVNGGLLAALGAGADLRINQSFTNAGVIWLNHATAAVTLTDSASNLVNAVGGLIHGRGTVNAFVQNAGAVSNSTGGTLTFALAVNNQAGGAIRAYDGSSIAFNGAVTNSGTIGASNGSLLQFNQGLTLAGSGSLALNPSTAIITGTLLLGSSGTITMANSDDLLVLRGDFVNGSTDTNNFNTRYGVMTFGGSTPLSGPGVFTNTFEVASTNKGAIFGGYDKNMALGTLNMTNHTEFVNNLNNGGGLGTNESLYVDILHLYNGATMKLSQLTIYVADRFIYEDGAGTKVLAGAPGDAITESNKDSFGLVNVFLSNGGQIVFVPEPSTGALIGLGLAALAGARRRRRNVS
jgi:autotransporter-associated beta strand protein/T5SS/PEP-CTERM-associated repeat protein